MAKKEEEIKITVICWQCDHKFSFYSHTITNHDKVVYLEDESQEYPVEFIQPKKYLVPCPKCGQKNKVTL